MLPLVHCDNLIIIVLDVVIITIRGLDSEGIKRFITQNSQFPKLSDRLLGSYGVVGLIGTKLHLYK